MRALLPILLLLAGCRAEAPRPASIEPGEICAFCKMAISQSAYAAQLVDQEGNSFKFDDIGCMIRFVRADGRQARVAAYFVMDSVDRHWLEAAKATYVKSKRTASPMSSGLVAFADPVRARQFAAKSGGQVLRFDELWEGKNAEPAPPAAT